MGKPNQVMGQRAQEEVRGQGSEVVHFIDRVLPTNCSCPPTKSESGLQAPSYQAGKRHPTHTQRASKQQSGRGGCGTGVRQG